MRKIWIVGLAMLLLFAATACSVKNTTGSAPKDYVSILKDARSEEDNKYNPIIGKGEDGQPVLKHNPMNLNDEEAKSMAETTFNMLSFPGDQMKDYALSFSLMNVKAYGMAIIQPAEGGEAAVNQLLNNFITSQRQAMENYLPDQFDIANNAQLKTLPTGEIVLVMCENAADAMAKIEEALKG